jgi:hypothetical protein
MKFNLKERVVVKHSAESQYYHVGTVIAYTDDGLHIVENPYGSCSKHKPEDLVTEAEAKEIRAAAEAKQAKLEAEFQVARQQIKEKLDRASILILESQQLAADHNKSLDGLYPETDDLYSTLQDVGWISSNSNC